MKKLFVGILMVMVMVVGMVGCAGKIQYVQPNLDMSINKVDIIINKNKRVVWDKLLKKISNEYFVVNNLEYDSGFLNLSFSTNNNKFVNCGCYNIKVLTHKNDSKTKYECIPILSDSLVNKNYEGMWKVRKNHCSISGATNILVQEISKNKTKISFNIKYIVNVSRILWNGWDGSLQFIDFNMGFNSGSYGHSNGIMCKSTGFYENEILKIINSIK